MPNIKIFIGDGVLVESISQPTNSLSVEFVATTNLKDVSLQCQLIDEIGTVVHTDEFPKIPLTFSAGAGAIWETEFAVDEDSQYSLSVSVGISGQFSNENVEVVTSKSQQPFPSWIHTKSGWVPPVPEPESDYILEWDEGSISWVEGDTTKAAKAWDEEQAAAELTAWRNSTSCGPLQFRRALRAAGLMNAVKTVLESADEEVVEAWEYATVVYRTDPMIVSFGTALGKTDEELDDLFKLALTFK